MTQTAATRDSGGGAPGLLKPRDRDLKELQRWVDDRDESNADWYDETFIGRERYDGTKGQHYWRYNRADRSFAEQPVPPWTSEWMAPHIFEPVEQITARVAQTIQTFFGVPVSGDSDDRKSAAAATRIARYIRNCERFPIKRKKFTRLGLVDGEAWRKARWDAEYNGARDEIVPAHEILVDDWVEEEEQILRLVHRRWLHEDVVRSLWGDRRSRTLADLEPDEGRIPWHVRRRFTAIRRPSSGYQVEPDLSGLVEYLEVYDMPRKERGYERGRYRVYANDLVLWDSKAKGGNAGLPYIDAGVKLPFVRFKAFEKPGAFRGIGIPARTWPSVLLGETLVNQAIEHNAMEVYGMWLLDISLKSLGRMSTQPGRHFYYPMATTPEPKHVKPDAMDAQFMAIPQYILGLIDRDTGVADPLRGGPYKRAETLGAIAIATQEARGRIGSIHMEVDESERGIMEMMLFMERTYGRGKRTAQIIGRGRVSEIAAWENSDLWGLKSLHVVSAESLGDSKQLRMQNVIQLVQAQIITIDDARDIIELPTAEDEIESSDALNAQAAWNNVLRLTQGEMPEVYPTWDHRVHLKVLSKIIGIDAVWFDMTPEQQQNMLLYAGMLEAEGAARMAGKGILESLAGGGGRAAGRQPMTPMGGPGMMTPSGSTEAPQSQFGTPAENELTSGYGADSLMSQNGTANRGGSGQRDFGGGFAGGGLGAAYQ